MVFRWLCLSVILCFSGCSKDVKERKVILPAEGEQKTDDVTQGDGKVLDGMPDAGNSPDGDASTNDKNFLELRKDKARVFWAHRTANAMTSFYDRDRGLWLAADVWENPHTFIALSDFMILSGNHYHIFLIDNEAMGFFPKNPELISPSYQNTAWWAIALLKAYDLTKEARYLAQAKRLGDYLIAEAWDSTTCGGGMWKDKAHSYLDASSSEVYIYLMAALHNRISGDTTYLAQAKKSWTWFINGPFMEGKLIANFIQGGNGKCTAEPSKSYYSHNQGVILGAAAELYKATLDQTLIAKGLDLAKASMVQLSVDGYFKEFNADACKACTGQGSSYKGVYVRYLRELAEVSQSVELYAFLDKNAAKAWEVARSPKDLIGYHWNAPFDTGDLQRQQAALDLFNSQIYSQDPANLARSASVTASTQCVAHHNPKDANDGSAINKWCAAASNPAPFITLDLGDEKAIGRLKLISCGGGTESLDWNTKDFNFSIASNPNGPFKELAKVTGNQSSFWTEEVKGSGRYLRLTITQGGADGVARINEIIVEK